MHSPTVHRCSGDVAQEYADGLVNRAQGRVMGFKRSPVQEVTAMSVLFDDPHVGRLVWADGPQEPVDIEPPIAVLHAKRGNMQLVRQQLDLAWALGF